MSPDLESSIAYLQSTNDPVNAYFSFTVDETGEYGIIKANKEGLRLYAAEMLKKSLELEKSQDGQPLFFGHLEWVISDSGYDLIAGIVPQYQTRTEILTGQKESMTAPQAEAPASSKKEQIPSSGCFFTIMMWVIAGLILLFAHKAFPNLHPWESIH